MHLLWTAPLLAALAAASTTTSSPVVVNPYNSIKYVGISEDGVDQFMGIRFAEDTGGANRLEPPKPYYPTHGSTVDASEIGASCPQATPGAVPCMAAIPKQSEDCLNLRIAKPSGADATSGLPVMVYIYGGGSILGSAYDTFFIPSGLVQQSVANGEPVIYVGINYRVGIFGFAASEVLNEAKAANLGLQDQYVALEWIRDNIASFGGDPSRVTIFGQSFGGISVGLQLTAYGGERPALFSKAIMTSGGVSGDRTGTEAYKNTGLVADKLGCTTTKGVVDKAALDCMKKAPGDDIAKANLDVAHAAKPPFGFAAFPPAVDGDFIPDQPDYLLAEGRFLKNIPLIVTWARDDGSMMIGGEYHTDQDVINSFAGSFPYFNDDIAAKMLELYPLSDFEDQAASTKPKASAQYYRASRINRDIDPTCPMLIISRALYEEGQKDIWIAELNETRLTPYWDGYGVPWGVSHLSDVPYFFNEPLPAPADNGPEAMALSANYSGSFSSFASTGNPVSKGKTTFQDWPRAFSPGTDQFKALVIGGPFGTAPASSGPDTSTMLEEEEEEKSPAGSSLVDISIRKGKQIVFEAMIRSGSFASAATEIVTGGKGVAVKQPGHARQKMSAQTASTFEDEKLLARCHFIYKHRV